MGEIIYGDIKQYIDELAQSLGVAAEHVYELLVRQQVISGIVWTSVGVVIIAICLTLLLFTVIAHRKSEYEYEDAGVYYKREIKTPANNYAKIIEAGDGALVLVVTVVASLILLITSLTLPENVMHIFNPEYYAIREIMDVFKGGE